MFALIFDFPTGRYHATPWGRHVNEADVAWPPEPWRILRTLIACYWRKGNRTRWPESRLSSLIDALASTLPVYSLPEGTVHMHTRHYMPAPAKKPSLIFDAFAHVPKDEKLMVAWPDLALDTETFELAADLASGIGYLGRAESWTECQATIQWDSQKANCLPIEESDIPAIETVVRVIAARSAHDYATERGRLTKEFEAVERTEAETSGKRPPTSSTMEKRRRKAFGPTLPERLIDALALDTADYQKYGWSRPPAAREVLYERPLLSAIPRLVRRREVTDDRSRFTVARFLLAGRPRPRTEDSVKIGELMRLAALSKFGWEDGRPKAPSVISGRGTDNKPLRDAEHTHTFWLPEDADGDGWIDHISVYAPSGFPVEVREKLDCLTRLWVRAKDSEKESGNAEPGRQEWRLALEGFGRPGDFKDTSRIFGRDRIWVSVTPFLATGHLKKSGYTGEIRRLLKRRKVVPAGLAEDVEVEVLPCITVNGAPRRAVHFHRFRGRGGEEQLDTQGALLRLSFPEPISGPLSLGYASHFGLGMFAKLD